MFSVFSNCPKADAVVLKIVVASWEGELFKEAQLIANRIENHDASCFRFLKLDNLEPTNNEAERALRSPVIDRRITQGSRSPKGLLLCHS